MSAATYVASSVCSRPMQRRRLLLLSSNRQANQRRQQAAQQTTTAAASRQQAPTTLVNIRAREPGKTAPTGQQLHSAFFVAGRKPANRRVGVIMKGHPPRQSDAGHGARSDCALGGSIVNHVVQKEIHRHTPKRRSPVCAGTLQGAGLASARLGSRWYQERPTATGQASEALLAWR